MQLGSERGILRCGIASRLAAAAALALAAASGAPAAPADDGGFPKALSCTFASGQTWSYENGVFSSKPPQPLSFRIEAIDLEAQTAILRSGPDAAAGKLSVVRALNANHFLEAVTEGFLNLTTVYDLDKTVGKHPAVHSRHFGLLGQPVFGQYTGFCTAE